MSETATKTRRKKPAEDHADVEVIVPPKAEVTVDGVECRVRRLKTREFLALMQVLTSGLGPAIRDLRVDLTDEETAAAELSALMLLAVPNAVDEFTVFLRAVVEPVNDRDRGRVASYLMDNPDLDVMLDVFEQIAAQEADDLAALVGKAQAMWSRLAPLYSRK